MDNAAQPSDREKELKPGEVVTYPALPHWTFKRFSKEEMKAAPGRKPYLLSCTPFQVEKLKQALAANNLPQFAHQEIPGMALLRELGIEPESTKAEETSTTWLPQVDLKGHIRLCFKTKEEAWDYAMVRGPQRLKVGLVFHEIPADLMAKAVEIALQLINDPDGHAVDPSTAVTNELARLRGKARTVKELAAAYLNVAQPGTQIDHPKGHLQRKGGWVCQQGKIIFDLARFFGPLPPNSVTEAHVDLFISYLRKVRGEYYSPERDIKRSTLIKNLYSVSAMFTYGQEFHGVVSNPFTKIKSRVKKLMPAGKLQPKPQSVEEIVSLLLMAWKMDKQICLAIVLSSFCGLRRGEMLKSLNSAIRWKYSLLTVTADAAKRDSDGIGRTRTFRLPAVAWAWLRMFEFGPPNGLIFGGMSSQEYDDRLYYVREAVQLGDPERWGKDKMRKNRSMQLQHLGEPIKDIQDILGHLQDSKTTAQHYFGDADPEWANTVLDLFPQKLLGEDVAICSLEERFKPMKRRRRPVKRKGKSASPVQPSESTVTNQTEVQQQVVS